MPDLPYDPADPNDILRHARCLKGYSIRELCGDGIKPVKGKGEFGALMEAVWFNLPVNNEPRPDFPLAGVELKTSPVVGGKGTSLRIKERMVLGMIDYTRLVDETWETSSFVKKNSLILVIFYDWLPNKDPLGWKVRDVALWPLDEPDLAVMREDWSLIQRRVRSGQAHELSESQTLYVGACTKSSDSSTRRSQPNSPEPAKPRAFSLKRDYVQRRFELMSKRSRAFALSEVGITSVDTSPVLGRSDMGIRDQIIRRFDPYLGMTFEQICARFSMDPAGGGKGRYNSVTRRIIGFKSGTGKIEEFEKAGVTQKTLRIKSNGSPKEAVSFPKFVGRELLETESWEMSDWYAQLTRTFLFVVYRETSKPGELVLDRVFFWSIPEDDLEVAGRVWSRMRDILSRGTFDGFPRASEGRVGHVRPHGLNASDKDLSLGDPGFTKQSFWLNANYIGEIVSRQGIAPSGTPRP